MLLKRKPLGGRSTRFHAGDSARLRLTQRVSFSLLSAFFAGCSRAFVEVVVPPATCASTVINGEPRPLECAAPVRFGLARANARIAYPPVFAQAGISGRVGASVWVGVSGAVDSVRIGAVTNSQFSASVERALRTWRFRAMRTSLAPQQRLLPVEVLFRFGGCPDPIKLQQRVVALHTGIVVEVLGCGVYHTLRLP